MSLSFQPEIEPLPESAWTRIEEDLFTTLDSRSQMNGEQPPAGRRSPLRALALVAIVAVLAGLMLVILSARHIIDDSQPRYIRIVTGASSTDITLHRATITVAPNSTLSYSDTRDGVDIMLERGTVDCAVAPQPQGATFEVYADDVRVEVVGTRFSVTRHKKVQVAVDSGVVAVYYRGKRILLTAGQKWPPPPPAIVASPTPNPTANGAQAPPPAAKKPSRKSLYNRALTMSNSHPKVAIQMLEGLSKGNDSWAALSLIEIAHIYMRHGPKAKAKPYLESYIRRFPKGKNIDDARALLGQFV